MEPPVRGDFVVAVTRSMHQYASIVTRVFVPFIFARSVPGGSFSHRSVSGVEPCFNFEVNLDRE